MVDFSWSYAKLNWSLEPDQAFKINKQISVSKLGCQHLQSQEKCASCLSIFMGQVCAHVSEKGWHQSQNPDWSDRATASAPPPHSHSPKMPTPWARSSGLEFGCLVFLLIKSEKWLERDWVHVLHNRWWKICFLLQFSLWNKDRWLKTLAESKQAINQHLFMLRVLTKSVVFHDHKSPGG